MAGNVAALNAWLNSFAATDNCGIASLKAASPGCRTAAGDGSATTFTATDVNRTHRPVAQSSIQPRLSDKQRARYLPGRADRFHGDGATGVTVTVNLTATCHAINGAGKVVDKSIV